MRKTDPDEQQHPTLPVNQIKKEYASDEAKIGSLHSVLRLLLVFVFEKQLCNLLLL